MAKLQILSGKREGEEVELPPTSPTLTVGNRKNAEVSIRDPWISWDHAALRIEGGAFSLEDLGSSNGTYVNQQKVQKGQKVALKDGDEIHFGKTKVRFVGSRP